MRKKIGYSFIIMIFFAFVFLVTSCDNVSTASTSSSQGSTGTMSTTTYTRVDNKIYFGTYPQTNVTDVDLITSLNEKAGTLPTSTAVGNWTDYNYYISSSVTSYMYYQDIDYDNDGDYDYRGVYFTQYRPTYSSSSSSTNASRQDDNGYSTNTVYWFSYDPIEWNILEVSNDKALIIANLTLDSQEYYPSDSTSSFEHNGGTGYANNYELSNIRKWLNDNFYNIAFNDLQKDLIETTKVDNSASSIGNISNEYVCNNTNDKMFLLSNKEATTYYTSDEERQTKGTDYAKCQGLFVYPITENSNWWLRSPDSRNAAYPYYVIGDGEIYCCFYAFSAEFGIRPACYINL